MPRSTRVVLTTLFALIILAATMALFIGKALADDTVKSGEPACITTEAITPQALEESFQKHGELAAQYGITLRRFDGPQAVALIKLADEIKPDPKYPGDVNAITTVIVFRSQDAQKLPRSRVFVYRGDDCEIFRLDWETGFVKELLNEYDKRNV